ncbi:MAG: hypothetical protein AB9836_07560 [Aminipila sp.]
MAIDNYLLTLIKNTGKTFNITPIIGSLSWKDSLDTLGVELSFSKAHSDEKYLAGYDVIEVGDKTILTNNGNEVFRGIITDEDIQGRTGRSYTAYDYMFYMNKSKTDPIQVNKEAASQAITRLCQKLNIGIYSIPHISTKIDAIYKDKTFAEILLDILDQSTNELGIKYKAEMKQGKLYIAKHTDLVINATYQMSYNTPTFDVGKAIGSVSKQRSIGDMRNSIIVTSSEESDLGVKALVKDSASISKYGLLQENVSVDSKDFPQAYNIAKNKLTELNKITESTSIELLGDDRVLSGRILNITEPLTKLSGTYLVKDVTHNYTNKIHKMSLTVESKVM